MALSLPQLLLAAVTSAQSWFADAREHRHLPFDRSYATGLCAADLDGDGWLDLLIPAQRSRVLRGGAGGFVDVSASMLPAGDHSWSAVVALDIDGDGDQDLFAGTGASSNTGTQDRLYVNVGGRLVDATSLRLPSVVERTRAVLAADFDHDGDVDVLAGAILKYEPVTGRRWDGYSRLYLNDGNGYFSDGSSGRLNITPEVELNSLVAADVDRDGWQDVFVAHATRLRLLAGGPGATFTDVSAARVPQVPAAPSALSSGDVDRDGDADLVVGYPAAGTPADVLLLNDGTGSFALAPAGALPADAEPTYALGLADFDGDGDLDCLVGNSGRANSVVARDRAYRNDGAGRFTEMGLPSGYGWTRAVVAVDLDRDGDVDLCSVGWGTRSRLYLGDGGGAFVEAALPMLPGTLLAAADFDFDGDLDAIGQPDEVDGPRLFTNDGRGVFAMAATPLPGFPMLDSTKVVGATSAADVDGDGDADLVMAVRSGAANVVQLNDGTGQFASRTIAGSNDDSRCLALGDVDRDGDIDVVFGNDYGTTGAQNRLYRNDGVGVFTLAATALPTAVDRTWAVAFGDLDRDGDLDLVAGNYFGQTTLALNDGTGVFVDATATRLPQGSLPTRGLALADFDGDGDLDLALANDGQDSRIWLNDGSGSFAAAAGRLPAGIATARCVVAADLDEDGDVDLALAGSHVAWLLVNDGLGWFRDESTRMPTTDLDLWRVAALDLDGDRDLDLAFGGTDLYGYGRVLLNRLRSLETPRVPTVGGTWQLEVHASGGTPGPLHLALPLLGFATARLPVPPLGTLRLDPATSISLPVVTFAGASAPLSLVIPIPADGTLLGLRVMAQALVADPAAPGSLHLTALTAATIWR